MILFVGATFPGSRHDYAIFKEEFPPGQPWLKDFEAYLDRGFQGICSDYEGNLYTPYKKSRKSKNNPDPELTPEEQEENRRIGRIRVAVEHAISGMKRYNILVHAFRNRTKSMVDDVIGIAAGLWNFLKMTTNSSTSICA